MEPKMREDHAHRSRAHSIQHARSLTTRSTLHYPISKRSVHCRCDRDRVRTQGNLALWAALALWAYAEQRWWMAALFTSLYGMQVWCAAGGACSLDVAPRICSALSRSLGVPNWRTPLH
jgi:hypothetical protein